MREKQEPSLWVKLTEREASEIISCRWRTPKKQALIGLASMAALLVSGLTIIDRIEGVLLQVILLVPLGALTMVAVLKAMSVPKWYMSGAMTALESVSRKVVGEPIIK